MKILRFANNPTSAPVWEDGLFSKLEAAGASSCGRLRMTIASRRLFLEGLVESLEQELREERAGRKLAYGRMVVNRPRVAGADERPVSQRRETEGQYIGFSVALTRQPSRGTRAVTWRMLSEGGRRLSRTSETPSSSSRLARFYPRTLTVRFPQQRRWIRPLPQRHSLALGLRPLPHRRRACLPSVQRRDGLRRGAGDDQP